jgi:glycosyltransferase involved in cell wall biosynthesis
MGIRVGLVRRGDIGNLDGVTRFTFNLARGFKDLGNEVYIVAGVASKNPRMYFATARGIEVIVLSRGSHSLLESTVKHLIEGSRILGDIGADMVIANGAIPLISKAVKISVNHGNAITEYRRSFPASSTARLYTVCMILLCVSSKVRMEMESVGIICQRVIPIPLILDNYECEHSKGNYILFVSGDYRRKKLDVAIETVRVLRREGYDLTLKVVGSTKANLVSEDHVEFVGRVSDEELRRLYSMALALIHPSEWEGFPYAVLEAQASCTPVVVGPGVPGEALIHGVTGFRVTSFNPVDYARVIAGMISNKDLFREMCVKAREYAERFDHVRIAGEYLKLYHEIR